MGKRRGVEMEQKYFFNERIDQALRDIYAGNRCETVLELSRKTAMPYQALTRRARTLGIAALKSDRRPWSQEEEKIVSRNIHHSANYIWKRLRLHGHKRTLLAVRRKISNARLRGTGSLQTTSQIALCFGCSEKDVRRWIRAGQLAARIRDAAPEVDRQHYYLIDEDDVREFIQRYPTSFNIKLVDQLWFVSLCFKGKIGNQVDRDEDERGPRGLSEIEKQEWLEFGGYREE